MDARRQLQADGWVQGWGYQLEALKSKQKVCILTGQAFSSKAEIFPQTSPI